MRKKVCIITASEITIKAFLLDQISKLCDKYDVTVIVNTLNTSFLRDLGINARLIPVAITRKVSVFNDLKALIRLVLLFRMHKFDIIHSITPKAGLLAMAAGMISGVRIRIHTFTGQVWVTKKGISRALLKQVDRLLALFTTSTLVDSHSQRDFLINQGIISPDKSTVLGKGSICGVDPLRFRIDTNIRATIRSEYCLDDDNIVFLFLGRLTKDKGLLDLVNAFYLLCGKCSNVKLLIVGPDEGNIKAQIIEIVGKYSDCVFFVDYTNTPEHYFTAADILCLPSYREGFGNVVIEGACAGIPAIGSDIYGVSDAIVDGHTGLLFNVGDIDSLLDKMHQLASDPNTIKRLGNNARLRAAADFSQAGITSALMKYYSDLLAE